MDERSRPRGGQQDERLEMLEQRMDELESRRSPVDRSRSLMGMLIPSETRQHLRAAGREQLLAARTLLDYWIARLRDEPATSEKDDTQRQNIRID